MDSAQCALDCPTDPTPGAQPSTLAQVVPLHHKKTMLGADGQAKETSLGREKSLESTCLLEPPLIPSVRTPCLLKGVWWAGVFLKPVQTRRAPSMLRHVPFPPRMLGLHLALCLLVLYQQYSPALLLRYFRSLALLRWHPSHPAGHPGMPDPRGPAEPHPGPAYLWLVR